MAKVEATVIILGLLNVIGIYIVFFWIKDSFNYGFSVRRSILIWIIAMFLQMPLIVYLHFLNSQGIWD